MFVVLSFHFGRLSVNDVLVFGVFRGEIKLIYSLLYVYCVYCNLNKTRDTREGAMKIKTLPRR